MYDPDNIILTLKLNPNSQLTITSKLTIFKTQWLLLHLGVAISRGLDLRQWGLDFRYSMQSHVKIVIMAVRAHLVN